MTEVDSMRCRHSSPAGHLTATHKDPSCGSISVKLPINALHTSTQTCVQVFKVKPQYIWLIVVSFFFAMGFEVKGLGESVALYFVKAVGKNSSGLFYGLNVAEAIITPAMPFTITREGGICVPVRESIAESSGSHAGRCFLGKRQAV